MRNGKVELLRFIFAMTVLCYHVQIDYWAEPKLIINGLYLFSNGKLGVEFFFLISGFYMAKKIDSNYVGKETDNLGRESMENVLKKIKSILPYHLLFFTGALIVSVINIESFEQKIVFIINSLPNFLLLNSTGLIVQGGGVLAPEWFLSSMFISMLVLYPICKRFWTTYPYTVAPIIGFLGVGYLLHKFGFLPGNVQSWGNLMLGCNVRAFCELSLGVWIYVLIKKINDIEINKIILVFLRICEVICLFVAILLMCTNLKQASGGVLILLILALLISLSKNGLWNDSIVFQNKFILFLGKISLPIYLCQNFVRMITRTYMTINVKPSIHFLLTIIFTILLSCTVELLIHLIKSRGSISE